MNSYISLKDHVYNYISEMINSGKLNANEKINEQQISDELEVSRTPVREALIQLAGDGYLENLPRKGFRVKNISEENAKAIYEILGPLDGRAAWLSVDYLNDTDLSQLTFFVDSMSLAIDKNLLDKYDDLQNAFHDFYIKKCGNVKLVELIHQLKRSFIKKEYAGEDKEALCKVLTQTNEEHKKMLELFIKKDKDALQEYIRDVHWCEKNAKFNTW